ncbi:MAG: crossover junction endodeoxyribonuclease RuvC, partial [Ruthenibacterium sp.]
MGVDPGYAIVGYGALDYDHNRFSPVQYGAITTQSHTLFEDRLQEVYDDMTQLLQTLKPDVMAIETLYFSSNHTTV